MIQLKAPPLSSHQRKQVEEKKALLEDILGSIEARYKKRCHLQSNYAALRVEAEALDQQAKNYDREAEAQLAIASKQLSRIQADIEVEARADASGRDASGREFSLQGVVAGARELVSRLCQVTYEQLLGMEASAMAPFWPEREAALQIGRTSPCAQTFVSELLRDDSYLLNRDQLVESAKGAVSTLNVLLEKGVIFKFQGAQPEVTPAS